MRCFGRFSSSKDSIQIELAFLSIVVVVSKKFFRSKLEDLGKLIFVKGNRTGANVGRGLGRRGNRFSTGIHTLDHKMVQHHFLLCALNDLFFYSVFGHEAIHVDSVLLSNAMRATFGLKIVLWIPVRV